MRRIHLLRHGECDWNAERRYVSRSDRPLTARGEAQHQAGAAWLEASGSIRSVVSSGLVRTDALARALGSAPAPDLRWREIDHGDWEGLTYRECQTRFGEAAVQARFADPLHIAPEGGETLADLSTRVTAAWEALAPLPSPIAVCSHAGPIQALLSQLFGLPLEQHWRWQIDPGSITTLEVHGLSVILVRANQRPGPQNCPD